MRVHLMEIPVVSGNSGDICVHLSGQPFSVNLCTVDRIGSHCVSAAIFIRWLLVKADMDMASTLRLSLICVSVHEGRQLRASARSISLPGLYVMVMSYCCSQRSILCSLTGAAIRFFMLIISSWFVVCFNHKCSSIQVSVELLTAIYNG